MIFKNYKFEEISEIQSTQQGSIYEYGRTDSAITTCLPKFLWGHKNVESSIKPKHITFHCTVNMSSSIHNAFYTSDS